MLVLDEKQVRALISMPALISAMEQALIDFSAGRVQQPVRTIIPLTEHGGLFAVMPAVYGDVLGAKLVSVYPHNVERGMDSHQATIQLFRSGTGEPLVTMDGRLITEMRTAAVSAVAARHLADPNARVLAILGSGVQARAHVEAMRLVRSFDEVRVWSRNASHAAEFAREHGATVMSAEEAVRGADVIVTVTGSAEPVLRGAWLSDTAFVAAVGAVGPTRRELDTNAMRGTVIVDSRDAAAKESGDVLLANAPIYAELGEVLARRPSLPLPGPIVFKSLGLAVEDLAAARIVWEAAKG
jgi:thiomorpholine-carboxylate dehydrogenase